jgi:prepilin-type processing-associated H-X9-DG protein
MDGVRYVDYSTGKISYNPLTWQDEGGNFLTLSPAFPNAKPDGNPYKRKLTGELTDEAIQFAYRHVNTSLNVVFFDGHCENLEEEISRDAAYYFPSGSRMRLLSGLPYGYTSGYTIGNYIP